MKKKVITLLIGLVFTFSGNAQSYFDYVDKIRNVDGKDRQYDMCISPDKKLLAIATLSTIKIVDVQNFKIIKIIPVDFETVNLLSFLSTNDKLLIVAENKDETIAEIYSLTENKVIKKTNPIIKGKVSREWNRIVYAKSPNYLVCVTSDKKIFISDCNSLNLIKTLKFSAGKGKLINKIAISNDESLIAFDFIQLFGGTSVLVFDFNGILKYSKEFDGGINGIAFSNNNDLFVSELQNMPNSKYPNLVYKIDLKSEIIKEYNVPNRAVTFMFYSENFIAFESPTEGGKQLNKSPVLLTLLFLKEDIAKSIPSYNLYYKSFTFKDLLPNLRLIELSDDIYLLNLCYENFSYVFNSKTKKLLGYIYHNSKGIAFVSSDGRFTGDNEALANLRYNIYSKPSIPLTSQVNQFYTPKLFSQILTSSYIPETNIADLTQMVKMAPEMKITLPDSISEQKTNTVNVRYTLKDNGDGVKEVRFYINGKLMNGDIRGFKVIGDNSQEIPLLSGDNVVEAVAVSNSGYQSSPDRVVVKLKGTGTTANLYVLGIGIDQYKNSKYNLNYAVADVSSVVDYIKTNGVGIFKNIDTKSLTDQQATKTDIVAELNRIAQTSNESDVFVLYYAGHGVMSEGSSEIGKDYYMVLSDVYQMFGNDNLLSEKGLSAGELREFCKKIRAQKQVILLDACQSGGATETFAMRGASEEKAIIQLAQSTGVFLISSTGAEQFATEFAELKHGVFTYALLDGLKGAADGGNKDGKITIKELESFLNDRIPELTQKYRGSMQFPNTWSRGMDFPIVISK